MSSGNSWDKKRFPLPPSCNPSPAVFNWKDKTISFMPCPLPRDEFDLIQDFQSQNHPMLKNEYSANSVTRHLPGSESRIIQEFLPHTNQFANKPNLAQNSNLLQHPLSSNKTSLATAFHPPTIQMRKNEFTINSETHHLPGSESIFIHGLLFPANQFANGPNLAQNSDLLQHQLSSNKTSVTTAFRPPTDQMLVNKSNAATYLHHQLSSDGTEMTQVFHPVTPQPSLKESNISQQSCSQSNQLPSNENFNMFNQQLPASDPNVAYPPHVPFLSAFARKEKYPTEHQQSTRESIMHQCIELNYKLGMPQNRFIPSQQRVGNQCSYPLSANFPEMGFNAIQETSVSYTSLHQNLYPQYFEKVHICVIGPPLCGKADLIRAFGKSDRIRIAAKKPLGRVLQHGIDGFGTTLKIDVWYADELTPAADDLRYLCQTSKSAIILVYSVAQKSTLETVLEWIKILKSDVALNVPIILIANTNAVDFPLTSREAIQYRVPSSDGVRAKEEYDLAAFYELSDKCVKVVDEIFLTATLNALNRTIQKSIRVW